MNAGTAIVLVIVVIVVAVAVWTLLRGGHDCCSSNGDCGACGGDCQGRAKIYGINVDAQGNAMDCSQESCPHCKDSK